MFSFWKLHLKSHFMSIIFPKEEISYCRSSVKKNRLYLVSKKCDSAHKCFKFKFQLWIIILSLLKKFKFMNLNSNFKQNNFFFILQMQENQNKAMLVQYFTLPDIFGMSWNSLSLAKSNLSCTYPFDDNKDMPQMF